MTTIRDVHLQAEENSQHVYLTSVMVAAIKSGLAHCLEEWWNDHNANDEPLVITITPGPSICTSVTVTIGGRQIVDALNWKLGATLADAITEAEEQSNPPEDRFFPGYLLRQCQEDWAFTRGEG